jgi:hypothetical protein
MVAFPAPLTHWAWRRAVQFVELSAGTALKGLEKSLDGRCEPCRGEHGTWRVGVATARILQSMVIEARVPSSEQQLGGAERPRKLQN